MFIYKLRGCAKCPSPIPQPTYSYWHSSRTLHTLESPRPQKYFTRQRSAPGWVKGCHKLQADKQGETIVGGRGVVRLGGLVFLACACVFCLLRFRVGLGAVWASGCCVGFEVEVELSDTQSRPYHKAKKKDNDIVFFSLPPPPPLSCPAP